MRADTRASSAEPRAARSAVARPARPAACKQSKRRGATRIGHPSPPPASSRSQREAAEEADRLAGHRQFVGETRDLLCGAVVAVNETMYTLRAATAVAAALVLLSLDGVVRPAYGGSCWLRMSSTGHCSGMLVANTTREKCCGMRQASGRQTYYVQHNLDYGRLFYYAYFAGGVPGCKPCHETCETLRCGPSERCRMRSGGPPRCVCSPNCSSDATSSSFKGPVCATDGRTYRSHCALLRANCRQPYATVEVSYLGQCQVQSCAQVKCAREGERCIVDQHNRPHCVTCQAPCPTRGVEPVCGTDGRTYETGVCGIARENCLSGTNVMKQYDGRCRDDMVCGEANCGRTSNGRCLYDVRTNNSVCIRCPPDCDPAADAAAGGFQMTVCGNDGSTYRSWCQMRTQACLTGSNVMARHVGECGADESSMRTLIANYYRHHDEAYAFEYQRDDEARHRKRGAKRKPALSR